MGICPNTIRQLRVGPTRLACPEVRALLPCSQEAQGEFIVVETLLSISYAGSFGFMRDGRRRFSVVTAKGIKRNHRCSGNEGCNVASPEVKWSLKRPIYFSSAFVQCRFGGTSCSSMLLFLR